MKKAAAWAIVGAFLPLAVDVATEPYARRGVASSWLHGAGKTAGLVVFQWACSTAFAESADRPAECRQLDD